MRLTLEDFDALDDAETQAGYRDGCEGWPVRQGASVSYLWGHDTGMTDGGHQPDYTHNQREFARVVLDRLGEGGGGVTETDRLCIFCRVRWVACWSPSDPHAPDTRWCPECGASPFLTWNAGDMGTAMQLVERNMTLSDFRQAKELRL